MFLSASNSAKGQCKAFVVLLSLTLFFLLHLFLCMHLFKFDVVPQTMLPLNSFQEYEKRLKADKRLFKSYSSLKELYEASIEMGFKLLPDSFVGFGLFNHTGKTLKPSLEPLRPFPVGPIESVPQELQNANV